MGKFIALFTIGFFAAGAFASTAPYFLHTRNENIREQIAEQPWRVLPRLENYTFAADTFLYKPWGQEGYYYHGNGYWINFFAEARPHKDFALNLKLAAYNGASSYGYGHTDIMQPFFGLTWMPGFLDTNWKLYFRYFDLDRQTLGAGLLLENKEMNGLIMSFAYNDWRYKGLIDGTGGFYSNGDLYYQQIDWHENRAGASVTFVNFQGLVLTSAETGNSRTVPTISHPTYTLFSLLPLSERWDFRAEAGLRNSALAAVAGITWTPIKEVSRRFSWELQARHYARGFGDQISGYVGHDYASPEIEDKSFIEGRNILAAGDGVTVGATRIDGEFRPKTWLSLATSNEIFARSVNDKTTTYVLSKQSAGLCPYPDRPNDCLHFFVSNKVVNAAAPRGGDWRTYSFDRSINFGVNGYIYF